MDTGVRHSTYREAASRQDAFGISRDKCGGKRGIFGRREGGFGWASVSLVGVSTRTCLTWFSACWPTFSCIFFNCDSSSERRLKILSAKSQLLHCRSWLLAGVQTRRQNSQYIPSSGCLSGRPIVDPRAFTCWVETWDAFDTWQKTYVLFGVQQKRLHCLIFPGNQAGSAALCATVLETHLHHLVKKEKDSWSWKWSQYSSLPDTVLCSGCLTLYKMGTGAKCLDPNQPLRSNEVLLLLLLLLLLLAWFKRMICLRFFLENIVPNEKGWFKPMICLV